MNHRPRRPQSGAAISGHPGEASSTYATVGYGRVGSAHGTEIVGEGASSQRDEAVLDVRMLIVRPAAATYRDQRHERTSFSRCGGKPPLSSVSARAAGGSRKTAITAAGSC
ncbi:hypothetical protein GIY23_02090 [Allosaccharopolyspora coralli]|uniref:Uncharacterized protein n=1 Tax=Allosaccharopolyspora coralli TaxID=2665642 RepID=A0A5Q3Q1Q3_9PSEU|nr:hypothetical protein [Allosaccharopolyspora coralli]QGK68508.1 hypothetical protein GIY23_02090 [Allosaccharopolyspora coralli]